MVGARGPGEGGVEGGCLLGTEFPFCKRKRVLDVAVVVAAQQCGCIQYCSRFAQKW